MKMRRTSAEDQKVCPVVEQKIDFEARWPYLKCERGDPQLSLRTRRSAQCTDE
jgi:hypothetical protein